MARPPDNRRDEAIAIIRRLCAEHGMKEGCRLARELFPDVPDGTWGRWRVQALGPAPDREEVERQARTAVAAEVRENVPSVTQIAIADADVLPAARRAIDFWRLINELDDDARLMRDYAVTTNPDGTRKLRVPFALVNAHRMRADLIRLALQHAEVAWSAERNIQFQDAIIAAIGEVDRELQVRVIDRLRRLQKSNEEKYGV